MRRSLLRSWWVVLLGLAGCDFKVNIPADTVVTCSRENSVCPRNMFCQLTLGRCLPSSGGDREAPRLVEARLSATQLKRGAPLEVTLEASEALSAAPTVTLVQGDVRADVPLVEGAEVAPRFLHRWPGTDALGEGPATVLVTLIDAAGNESAGLTAGVVTFDFTAPRVTELRYVSPRDLEADAGAVQVRPSESMSVRLSLSEPVRDGGVLVQRALDCAAPEVTWEQAANRDGVLDFLRGPSPVDTTCTWALEARGLVDLAGNVGVDQALTPPFHVNGVPPALGQLTLSRVAEDGGLIAARAFSRQPGFSRLVAEFTAEASTRRLVAALDEESLPDCTLAQACAAEGDGGLKCRCDRDVRAGDVEGAHVVAVQLTDSAGNQRSGTASLRLDFTAPALVPGTSGVLVSPRAGCPLSGVRDVGLGATARVLFTLDEAAARVPRVETSAPSSLPFTYESGAGTGFSFQHQLVTAPAQGALAVQVLVVDEAGNAAVLGGADAGLVMTVDLDAPAALPVDTSDAVLFSRAPWGDETGRPRFEVLGAGGAAEPGATVRVLPGPDAGAGLELGMAVADGDGGFAARLSNIDRTQVWVSAVDPACNEGPVARVRDVRWTASLQGKVPGVAFPNPHSLEAWPDFQGEQARVDAVEPQAVAQVGARDGVAATSQAYGQWSPLDGTAPPARGYTMMAWDAARQRLVFFGGYLATAPNRARDTWEFGPSAWSEARVLGDSPVARNGHSTGYDRRRHRVVIHGGFTLNGQGDDLWEWDGATWTQRTPSGPRPSARDSHAMAWDGNTQRLVLFGGGITTSTGATWDDQTWAWDGERWEQLALTGVHPTARYNHTLTWDPVRRRLLLFGGRARVGTTTTTANNDELWTFDGASWEQVPTSGTWPPARNAHHATFDTARGVLVIFGGVTATGSTNDTWEWDGTSWQQRTPPQAPPARNGGDMVFNEARGRVLLFGGFSASAVALGDTWEYDGTTWTAWSPASSHPSGRLAMASAWDPVAQRLQIFGGFNTTTSYLADTWTWADGGWTNRTDAGAAAPGRYESSAAWDPQRQRIVLFGGFGTGSRVLGDTWESDGFGWADAGVSDAGPTARWGHRLVYDPNRDAVLLTHGNTFTLTVNDQVSDTWARLDGGWVQLDAGVPPSRRERTSWTWDPLHREVLFFGGAGPGPTYLGDTWALTASGWAERAVPGPSGRNLSAMAWDGTSQRVVLYSGGDLTTLYDDTWEWDGQAWERRPPGPRKLPPLIGHSMTWDPVGRRVVLFGGRTYGNLDLGATWRYGVEPEGRPAWAVRFQLSRAGLETGDTLRGVTSRWVAGGSGAQSSAEPEGLRLWAWDGTTLTAEQLTAAPLSAPAELSWSTTDAARITRLQRGAAQELLFVVTPRGLNGDGRAAVAVDYVEVEVRYRHP